MNCLVRDEKIRKQRTKLRDQYISSRLWLFIFLSLGFLFFQSAEAKQPARKEAQWKCQGCGYRCWAQYPDMWGNYYCIRCGTKKN